MTPEEIWEQVLQIQKLAVRDYEGAHSAEDDLWRHTLELIANGAENPADLARAALHTVDLEFPRYCA